MIERKRSTLPSGARVVTVEAPRLHAASVAVYVRAGSRHEAPERMGIGHFLEHMFFRGSARFPDTVRMNAVVEAAGGNLNGVTTRDHACFYTPVHPAELEVAMEVLGDMLSAPRLVELETERQIILEEMMDEVDERGRDVDLENLSKAALFPGHGLSHKVAGTPRSVRAITLPMIRAHHARMYRGENLVVGCAGPIEHERVLELAARHFGRLPAGKGTVDRPPAALPPGPHLFLTDHEDSPQTELRLSFVGPPEDHPDHAALVLARRVLDDGLSSRLPHEVVERRGLAYDLHADVDTYADVSIFELEAACSHGKVEKVLAACAEVLGRFADEGPTEEELARAKRRHEIGLEFALDAAGELVGWFAGTELWRPAESFEERAARFRRPTAEDVRRVARTVLARENLTLVLVGRGGARRRARLERLLSKLPLPERPRAPTPARRAARSLADRAVSRSRGRPA